MKVIFLDVDGVLNCSSTRERFEGYIGVEQNKIALIKEIVDKTDAKIVLSSTWRLDFLWFNDGRSVKLDTFNYLKDELAKQDLEIFDVTPSHNDGWRGREIKEWLDNHTEVENYAVIDDNIYDIVLECKGHVVQTSWKTGLKPGAVKWVLQILNN